MTYKTHPLADAFPLIQGDAFDELVDDIATNGLISPITLWRGQIIDGRNRYRACQAAGIEPEFAEFEGTEDDARRYVVAANLRRRHLTESQRAMVAANLTQGGMSAREAAQAMSVSSRMVEHARTVVRSGDANVIDLVSRGELAVSRAANYARGRTTDLVTDGRRSRREPGADIDTAIKRLENALDHIVGLEPKLDAIAARWPGNGQLPRAMLVLRQLQARTQKHAGAIS